MNTSAAWLQKRCKKVVVAECNPYQDWQAGPRPTSLLNLAAAASIQNQTVDCALQAGAGTVLVLQTDWKEFDRLKVFMPTAACV